MAGFTTTLSRQGIKWGFSWFLMASWDLNVEVDLNSGSRIKWDMASCNRSYRRSWMGFLLLLGMKKYLVTMFWGQKITFSLNFSHKKYSHKNVLWFLPRLLHVSVLLWSIQRKRCGPPRFVHFATYSQVGVIIVVCCVMSDVSSINASSWDTDPLRQYA